MTIFVSVASYRDSDLPNTIQSMIENADNPQNLHIGVVQQSTRSEVVDFSQNPHIKNMWMPPQKAQGAGYARALAQEMYDGEDWFLQVDSHTRFDPGWDTKFIHMYEQASSSNERIILSHFPKAFVRDGNDDVFIDTPKYPDHPHRQLVRWFDRMFSGFRIPFDDPKFSAPEESETILAGAVFAPGHIVSEVPYDPDIVFWGEELCFSLRAWTRGWQIYSPNQMVLAHMYRRRGYHKIWDNRNNTGKRWAALDNGSLLKQQKIYTGELVGKWGAVDRESLDQYYSFIRQDPGKIMTEYLTNQELLANTTRESDIFDGMVTTSLSPYCMIEAHTQCKVSGCECECHT